MRWGLIPSWAKDPAVASRMINARAEVRLRKNPPFRTAFRRRRCLILPDGFYEWQRVPGSKAKRPMRIVLQDGGTLRLRRTVGEDGNTRTSK